jgi:hypothetical protein
VRRLQLPGPASRVAAKLRELFGERADMVGQHHAQHVQSTATWEVIDQARTRFLGPTRIRPEQHCFLGREVVEEGPRGDVRGRCDVLDGDIREAALRDEVECH